MDYNDRQRKSATERDNLIRLNRTRKADAFIDQMVKTSTAFKGLKKHIIMHSFKRCMNASINQHLRAVDFQHGVLYLQSNHPAWADELKHRRKDIIDKLNNFLGETVIKNIMFRGRFSNSELEKFNAIEHPALPESPEEWKAKVNSAPVSKKEYQTIVDRCSNIKNPELVKGFVSVQLKQLQREKAFQSEGYVPCPICGFYHPPTEELCPDCARMKQEELEKKIWDFLNIMPWAYPNQVIEKIPEATSEMVNYTRAKMVRTKVSLIDLDDLDSLDVKFLIMLYMQIPHTVLTDEKIQKGIKQLRFDIGTQYFDKLKEEKDKKK